MAIYRSISMSFWTDPKVAGDFTPEDRYFYLYCLTNPHTNLCGCYEVATRQIARETGYGVETVERLLRRLEAAHDVARYNFTTNELLILNWYRYNWTGSKKLDKPILEEIMAVKDVSFRAYLTDQYNQRDTVSIPYRYRIDTVSTLSSIDTNLIPDDVVTEDSNNGVSPVSSNDIPATDTLRDRAATQERHKHGAYGWVRLTEQEYEKLLHDLGEAELARCIQYIDESAQSNGNKNKWRDWNLVIRKCSREGWGRGRQSPPKKPLNDADYRIQGNPFK